MSIAAATGTTAPASPSAAPAAPDKDANAWDFSFKNLLDIINPLQHIPIVSTIYRKLTGDIPATPEKIAGDALYGGPVGFVSSIADSAFEALTGKNFGDTVLAFFTGGDKHAPALAQNTAPASLSAVAPVSNNAVGANSDTALRAAFAYRRSANLGDKLMGGTLAVAY